jgi:hypothetical protein
MRHVARVLPISTGTLRTDIVEHVLGHGMLALGRHKRPRSREDSENDDITDVAVLWDVTPCSLEEGVFRRR